MQLKDVKLARSCNEPKRLPRLLLAGCVQYIRYVSPTSEFLDANDHVEFLAQKQVRWNLVLGLGDWISVEEMGWEDFEFPK